LFHLDIGGSGRVVVRKIRMFVTVVVFVAIAAAVPLVFTLLGIRLRR
jgi:hypothetical protein